MTLRANLRIGQSYPRDYVSSSNGYFIGAVYREFAGMQSIGIAIGHSLDFADSR
jgi:hypothetical protein